MLTLFLVIFIFQCDAITIDNRFKTAYDYIINSEEMKSKIIPFIDVADTVMIEYPIKIEVSSKLKGLSLSSFPSIYKWLYPNIDKKSALDSLVNLSVREKEKPRIDSICLGLVNLSKYEKGKYILFFSIIENDKLSVGLYPNSSGDKDYKIISRFTRGCEFLFMFNSNGTIKEVHYQLAHVN